MIPNLLVDGISEAIQDSGALKIYVCNIMTQDGETEGMTAQDHVAALLEHGGPGLVDLCLFNSDPMRAPRREVELLGVEMVCRPLLDEDCGYARHSGLQVAQAVLDLYQQRADTKIF